MNAQSIAEKIAATPITPEIHAAAREPLTGSGRAIGTPSAAGAVFWADPIPLDDGVVAWLGDGRLCLAVKRPDGTWLAIGVTEARARWLVGTIGQYLDGLDRDQIAALAQLYERAKAGEVAPAAEG